MVKTHKQPSSTAIPFPRHFKRPKATLPDIALVILHTIQIHSLPFKSFVFVFSFFCTHTRTMRPTQGRAATVEKLEGFFRVRTSPKIDLFVRQSLSWRENDQLKPLAHAHTRTLLSLFQFKHTLTPQANTAHTHTHSQVLSVQRRGRVHNRALHTSPDLTTRALLLPSIPVTPRSARCFSVPVACLLSLFRFVLLLLVSARFSH